MAIFVFYEVNHLSGFFILKLEIISWTTEGSARVVTSPSWSCSPAAIFLRILLMILPDLVFGSPLVNWIKSGVAMGPILLLTILIHSCSSCRVPSTPSFRITNAYKPYPFTSCGYPTTAASATEGCSTSELSISAVERLCPLTIITSSTLPVIQ